ncbi:MAG TPA: 3-isopropylmalate dehydratase [Candidatus Acidoferrales bacterium]|nr:3-isopropylmalate dehydratase [Candidatus Acidoferrales bacterium]
MTALRLEGRARVFGDDVNTDYIIASRRKRESLDPVVLRQYLFEEIDPRFARSVEPGDLIVAGRNFGCGSAMEVAATVVLGAGIRAVLAASFSRTYFRNAVNNGLLPIPCDTSRIGEGDHLVIEPGAGEGSPLAIRDVTTGETVIAAALPDIMVDILAAGGLVPYFRLHGGFRV